MNFDAKHPTTREDIAPFPSRSFPNQPPRSLWESRDRFLSPIPSTKTRQRQRSESLPVAHRLTSRSPLDRSSACRSVLGHLSALLERATRPRTKKLDPSTQRRSIAPSRGFRDCPKTTLRGPRILVRRADRPRCSMCSVLRPETMCSKEIRNDPVSFAVTSTMRCLERLGPRTILDTPTNARSSRERTKRCVVCPIDSTSTIENGKLIEGTMFSTLGKYSGRDELVRVSLADFSSSSDVWNPQTKQKKLGLMCLNYCDVIAYRTRSHSWFNQ